MTIDEIDPAMLVTKAPRTGTASGVAAGKTLRMEFGPLPAWDRHADR
jgi:hypothetical protein